MTKLADLRDKLRTGELVEEHQERTRQYKVAAGGADAMILFGKHKHLTIQQIQIRDPAYLNWILQEDFPSELKDIVRFVMAAKKRADDVKSMKEAADALGEVAKGAVKKLGEFGDALGAGVTKVVDAAKETNWDAVVRSMAPDELKKLLDEASIDIPTNSGALKTRQRPPRLGGSPGFKPKAKHR